MLIGMAWPYTRTGKPEERQMAVQKLTHGMLAKLLPGGLGCGGMCRAVLGCAGLCWAVLGWAMGLACHVVHACQSHSAPSGWQKEPAALWHAGRGQQLWFCVQTHAMFVSACMQIRCAAG